MHKLFFLLFGREAVALPNESRITPLKKHRQDKIVYR